jgi:hypothetical protein
MPKRGAAGRLVPARPTGRSGPLASALARAAGGDPPRFRVTFVTFVTFISAAATGVIGSWQSSTSSTYLGRRGRRGGAAGSGGGGWADLRRCLGAVVVSTSWPAAGTC